MIRKLFIFFFLLVTTDIALSSTQKIVAIVNNIPITLQELEDRKKLILYLAGAEKKDVAGYLNQSALNSLIDDALFTEQANALRIQIPQDAIMNVIKKLEQQNNIPAGSILSGLMIRNIPEYTIKNKIFSELVKEKIISEILVKNINTDTEEINDTLIGNNAKDAKINMIVISSKKNDTSSYNEMLKLHKKIKTCKNIPPKLYNSFATISIVESTLSKLPSREQLIVKNLKSQQKSSVLSIDNTFKIIILCAKEIVNLTNEENANVLNLIGNKKLSIKFKKYYDSLYRKTYIEILDENFIQ